MNIEKVYVEDAYELLGIYSYYVENTAVSFEYETPTLDEFKTRIVNISSKFPYIKAVENGKIIGYAYATTFKGRKAYDWSVETTVYVRKENRRSGVGQALYKALEKSLSQMGVLNMNACIALPIGEDPHLTKDSVQFHERMGFKTVGVFTKSGYKFNRWYDMVWMEKLIGEHPNDVKEVAFGDWCL